MRALEKQKELRVRVLNLKWRIWHYSHCDSTNLIIKNAIIHGFDTGLVAISEDQREGYGTRGRRWNSPKGGLYFSMLLKTTLPASKLPEIPNRIANVIMITLQRFAKAELAIKQPNDIVLKRSFEDEDINEKLAGISTEIYRGYLVVGVGVNIFPVNSVEFKFTDKNLPVYLEDFAMRRIRDKEDVFHAILSDLNVKLEI